MARSRSGTCALFNKRSVAVSRHRDKPKQSEPYQSRTVKAASVAGPQLAEFAAGLLVGLERGSETLQHGYETIERAVVLIWLCARDKLIIELPQWNHTRRPGGERLCAAKACSSSSANLLNPTQLWVVNVVEAPQVARLTHHEAQIPVSCTG
jgi:hypothetical protein